jgi:hypothetical protein
VLLVNTSYKKKLCEVKEGAHRLRYLTLYFCTIVRGCLKRFSKAKICEIKGLTYLVTVFRHGDLSPITNQSMWDFC